MPRTYPKRGSVRLRDPCGVMFEMPRGNLRYNLKAESYSATTRRASPEREDGHRVQPPHRVQMRTAPQASPLYWMGVPIPW